MYEEEEWVGLGCCGFMCKKKPTLNADIECYILLGDSCLVA